MAEGLFLGGERWRFAVSQPFADRVGDEGSEVRVAPGLGLLVDEGD